ncbi:MAG: 3-deoxy-manno-octulosonate cytidylyltransferase [Alistipes sp.]|nr:3-deoxy-manno-octulosonate cytidylyltransferase [Alistipes sp.]
MKYLVIIPARYASTRFPAKPLALLGGRPIIEHVYRQVSKAVSDVVVATDDERIKAAVEAFGGRAVMTSTEHQSGTDRCYEALQRVGGDYDVVVNVQGDEPFVQPEQIEALIVCFDDPATQIATMVKPFKESDGVEALENPNSPKVVVSHDMKALYFSRSVIPYMRGVERNEWLKRHTYYKHIGIYAFRAKTLAEITALPQSPLELSEKLEQLRWLENGYVIGLATTNRETIGIDTPEDLCRAEAYLATFEK